MKIFKDWNLFEKALLFCSIVLVSFLGIIFNSNILITFSSILGIIAALLIAKGKNLGLVLGSINTILYSIVSFNNKFYGEVIIYMFMMLPMYIISIVSWLRHQNKKTSSVEINKISSIEWIVVSFVFIILFGVIYIFLKKLNTSELIISTFSVIASLFAIYLQLRRSRYNFYFYVVNDIVLILLWGTSCLSGNIIVVPMLMNPVLNAINDVYGIINWKRLEHLQSKN